MTDEENQTRKPLTESDSITRTKTALVFELADGRTVELTAWVQTARDNGLRAIEERFGPDDAPQSETQRVFDAATTTLIARDVDMEDDDPKGLLPTDVSHSDLDVDVPDDWSPLGCGKVDGKIGDPEIHAPVWEHTSMEAWLVVTKKLKSYSGGPNGGGTYPVFDVYIEAGTPATGLWTVEECSFRADVDELENVVQNLLDDYDHDPDSESGSESKASSE